MIFVCHRQRISKNMRQATQGTKKATLSCSRHQNKPPLRATFWGEEKPQLTIRLSPGPGQVTGHDNGSPRPGNLGSYVAACNCRFGCRSSQTLLLGIHNGAGSGAEVRDRGQVCANDLKPQISPHDGFVSSFGCVRYGTFQARYFSSNR